MDQSTPDRPTPDPRQPQPPQARGLQARPGAQPVAQPVPTPRELRIENRLRVLAGPDEHIVAWTRGWVSREVRAHFLFSARTLDFAVLTDRSLLLYSTGFFSRRPRRPVYASRIDRVLVTDQRVRRGRRLRVASRQAHPLRIELRGTARSNTFADALVARGRSDES